MLKIKNYFFSILFLSLFLYFSFNRPQITQSDGRNGLYGPNYPLVTLDGNSLNPLDQKLRSITISPWPPSATRQQSQPYHSPVTVCTAQHSTTQPSQNSLMHTASWLRIGSYFILPHILLFLCEYLSSQPHGCVEAVYHSLI